jgi:hypothetical protein
MGRIEREAVAADSRHERMDRVAVLYGEITAATREFLRALAECDKHRDWAEEGFSSCAEWLAWRIGITRNTANEKVRAARALEELPLISDAMARGEISFSKVRALTRAATPSNEAELLTYARAASTASLERLVRGWKTLGRLEEARAERLRHRLRSFSVFPSEEGMYVVKGVVTPEVGAMLMRAIEAAGDALYRASGRASGPESGPESGRASGRPSCGSRGEDVERPEPEQLRADALGLVAERALAAGFGRQGPARTSEGAGEGAEGAREDSEVGEQGGAGSDGSSGRQDGSSVPISGSRAERYQVLLHVEPETLRDRGEPGMSELEGGTRVTAETARRLACDAAVVEVRKGPDGSLLDVGRRSRTVSPALRRALEARDRGCRFPGCGLRFTDAHHIEHWADGGETSLRNTVLLCRRHHRLVHEDGHRVFSDREGRVVFFTPRGKAMAEVPPIGGSMEAADGTRAHGRGPAGAAAPLVARNRRRGVAPDWRIGLPTHRHERDIPPEVEIAALEAMDAALAVAADADEVA